MKITGAAKIIGIFGDPVGHTLSPAIHNAAFERLGLPYVYVPFHVKPAELKKAIEAIRALDMPGINITIPHKERALKFLDEADEDARRIGAVNTIVNMEGRLIGYNTDGTGYLRSLREETGFKAAGKNIIIIGAGGAARSIFYAILTHKPERVVLANRTVKRARALADEFGRRFNVKIEASGAGKDALEAYSKDSHLVVNTTSLGMMGEGRLDFPLESLPENAVVSDIVYRPLKTEFIKGAEKRALKVHTGLGMLIHQGAIGFELWTGRKAPVEVMRKAALKALKGKEAV